LPSPTAADSEITHLVRAPRIRYRRRTRCSLDKVGRLVRREPGPFRLGLRACCCCVRRCVGRRGVRSKRGKVLAGRHIWRVLGRLVYGVKYSRTLGSTQGRDGDGSVEDHCQMTLWRGGVCLCLTPTERPEAGLIPVDGHFEYRDGEPTAKGIKTSSSWCVSVSL
jgi:hypothetical protein